MNTFTERWSAVCAILAEAAARSGRALAEVELVAVSKGHPAEAIAEALAAGQLLFGESRVQETREKQAHLPPARWHFIGHLQKNKVRQALPLFEILESIDSLDLARAVDRVAGELALQPRVLLEVNIAAEASKHGFAPARLREEAEALLALPHLRIKGLMAIPPFSAEAEDSRPHFVRLRELKESLETRLGVRWPALSMGMSSDFAVAVEEGATLVRVGTALFGDRG